ncbi:MAG: SGNH/GDSL hydrolase family protein [Planctomycetota bacterium]
MHAGDIVLFQGDSITDCGRDREAAAPNDPAALGRGYAMLAAASVRAYSTGVDVHNRGISGNEVSDLLGRWNTDCVALGPTVVSVLIGVNDIWRKMDSGKPNTVEQYDRELGELLDRTLAELPGVRLMVCEPFALRVGAVTDAWFPEFDERRAVARKHAERVGARWVAFQDVFDRACARASAEYWAADGVHPSLAGHRLMADAWLKAADGI